ncbi:unnamed protein product [Hymenolepis diminuta]|uniref:ANK_REP_REGION domain-containing protein n=1 Tax=Hymenolepis diminuta TaxID=6216 RepID=A0A158QF68_HYMDI|nr:unnamed protein product [Hymenolepis diminuta]
MMGPDLGRIEKAKEERRKQLLKWDEYDRTYQNNFNHRSRKKGSTGVRFGSNLIFLEAASRGDLAEVKKLINSGINPDVANEDGLTALHQCCIDNNLDMCTLLLENNANVNAKDHEQWTPLHAAATCGNKELCGILINWGADLLALNIDGNMPYDLCDDDDTLILVETEMAKRHVTQKQIDEIRLGPEKEMLSDLKRHYAAGDDLQVLDVQGAAPIHIAAACGYPEVTRYLLQLNLEPQLPDQDGWLPIHIAVSWGHLEVIEILVAYGADLNATTKNDICDSKELQMRLKEVWDRREDLRSTVKKTTLSVNNNGNSNFTRGFGSSRRKSNTSIMRTSMRDKRRITRVDAERERQLGEQLASAVASKENGSPVEKVANMEIAPSSPKSSSASVNVNASTTNSNSTTLAALAVVSNSRKSLSSGPESKQTLEVYGTGSMKARRGNDSNTTIPVVPSRKNRPVRFGDGPLASQQPSNITASALTSSINDQHTKTSSSSTSTDNSTVTSNSTASNSSSASPSTFTETSESESSDSSRSNYVRPMLRNINGQMVPIVTNATNNSDSARSPPSQRSRPTPPSRDNRSRTPGRSGASVGSPASSYGSLRGQRVNTTAGSPATAQVPPPNPAVLRQGPLPQQPQNEIPRPKANNVTSPSSFISTETLNSDCGSGGRKPFLCCHTM